MLFLMCSTLLLKKTDKMYQADHWRGVIGYRCLFCFTKQLVDNVIQLV